MLFSSLQSTTFDYISVHDSNVFVVENHLKVMLEEDYLALESNVGSTKHGLGNITKDDIEVVSGVSAEIIREVLLPEIEKEVNNGKNFANLRQMYNSMLLATWYKKNLKESLLGQVYADKNKVNGIELEDKEVKQKIYDRYVEAFEKGVYNYIKEDVDKITNEVIPRKYFSGGLEDYLSEAGNNRFTETTGSVPSTLVSKARRPHVTAKVRGKTISSSPVEVTINKTKVGIVQGDITRVEADAVVAPANTAMGTGLGVTGAFIRALSRHFQGDEDMTSLRIFPTPEMSINEDEYPIESAIAVDVSDISTELGWKYIISGVVHYNGIPPTEANIKNTTKEVLRMANDRGIQSIALPSFGTGIMGIEFSVSARQMLSAVQEFLEENRDTSLREITFILFGGEGMTPFGQELATIGGVETSQTREVVTAKDLDVDVSTQPLVQFYAGLRGDHRDRRIQDMWDYDHDTLENEHDLIQMMFPSNRMGMFFQMWVTGVSEDKIVWPQLVTGDVEIWTGDTNTGRLLRANMLRSLETMLNFYGFRFNFDNPAEVTIERGDNFEERRQNWLNEGNHNFLRIDRILNSMKFVGLEKYSLAFFNALSEVHDEYGEVIDVSDSFTFWKNSVGSIETTDKLTVAEHKSNLSASSSPVGGIDFNPNNVNFTEQGDKIQINFSASNIENLNPESINGILPVIINISPLPSFLPLLGLEPQREKEFELSQMN